MNDFSLKSVVLNGNLKKDSFLVYKFANNECEIGLWRLAVKSVYYRLEEGIKQNYIHICTNLVRDFKISQTSSLKENFFPTIASFTVKGTKNDYGE